MADVVAHEVWYDGAYVVLGEQLSPSPLAVPRPITQAAPASSRSRGSQLPRPCIPHHYRCPRLCQMHHLKIRSCAAPTCLTAPPARKFAERSMIDASSKRRLNRFHRPGPGDRRPCSTMHLGIGAGQKPTRLLSADLSLMCFFQRARSTSTKLPLVET
ncbi:hypothetical protein BC834DRAFT_672338 [Gloeopeniophorella convolvens]|nr:hypothetical protein BC834DRAFT_672338 [Gloeopeniophorella convolvens]